MERANCLGLAWCCPAPASAPATRTRASACQYGPVMERATCLGLLVLPGPGQRLRDLGQSLCLPIRVGDGTGDCLGLLVLPGPGQRPRDQGQGTPLPGRVGDGAGNWLGLPRLVCGLLCCPAPASAPATCARASRLPHPGW